MKISRPATFLVIPFLLLCISSCSGINLDKVLGELNRNPGSGTYIAGVPFYPQDEQMCGPASVASVLGYYGRPTLLEEASDDLHNHKIKGTLPVDLYIYAKDKGFDASYYKGGLDDLREKLSSRRPLILFLNLGYDAYPVGHYIVAVGYNDTLGAVVAHSGMDAEDVLTYNELTEAWSKTGYSTLLITPKVD